MHFKLHNSTRLAVLVRAHPTPWPHTQRRPSPQISGHEILMVEGRSRGSGSFPSVMKNGVRNNGRTAPRLLSAGSQRCETSPMLQQGSSKELSSFSLGATTPGRSTGRQAGEKLGTICGGSPSVDREDHVLPHPKANPPLLRSSVLSCSRGIREMAVCTFTSCIRSPAARFLSASAYLGSLRQRVLCPATRLPGLSQDPWLPTACQVSVQKASLKPRCHV